MYATYICICVWLHAHQSCMPMNMWMKESPSINGGIGKGQIACTRMFEVEHLVLNPRTGVLTLVLFMASYLVTLFGYSLSSSFFPPYYQQNVKRQQFTRKAMRPPQRKRALPTQFWTVTRLLAKQGGKIGTIGMTKRRDRRLETKERKIERERKACEKQRRTRV